MKQNKPNSFSCVKFDFLTTDNRDLLNDRKPDLDN